MNDLKQDTGELNLEDILKEFGAMEEDTDAEVSEMQELEAEEPAEIENTAEVEPAEMESAEDNAENGDLQIQLAIEHHPQQKENHEHVLSLFSC